MANETKPCVRVLEIRAAENGWVISGFERSQDQWGSDATLGPYFSMVAETPKRCTEIVGKLLERNDWEKDVMILPARRERKVRA
jgi:hypothetical protein